MSSENSGVVVELNLSASQHRAKMLGLSLSFVWPSVHSTYPTAGKENETLLGGLYLLNEALKYSCIPFAETGDQCSYHLTAEEAGRHGPVPHPAWSEYAFWWGRVSTMNTNTSETAIQISEGRIRHAGRSAQQVPVDSQTQQCLLTTENKNWGHHTYPTKPKFEDISGHK